MCFRYNGEMACVRMSDFKNVITESSDLLKKFSDIYAYEDPMKWSPVKQLFSFRQSILTTPDCAIIRNDPFVFLIEKMKQLYDVIVSPQF